MKKIFINLLLVFVFLFAFFAKDSFAVSKNYKYLNNMESVDSWYNIVIDKNSKTWETISKFARQIASSLRTIFIAIAIIFFLIRVIALIVSNNTEEEIWNFKKWFIWISIWLIIVNIAAFFVNNIYSNDKLEEIKIGNWKMDLFNISNDILNNIINPFIEILKFWASFFFILIAVYSFFKLITANGNEEAAKDWKMSIFYAIIWFIVVKISSDLVLAVYWKCGQNNSTNLFNMSCSRANIDVSKTVNIITSIINWLNSFVAIFVIIMIIFSWARLIFSVWEEEKMTKAKKSLVYIVIWIWILLFNYLILTFILYN